MNGEKIFTIQNQNAGTAVIFGFYAALITPDLFSRMPNLYAPMLSLAPQTFWGCLLIVVGLAAWVLSFYGRRWIASFLLGAIYVFFAVMYYNGDNTSPGGSLYMWVGAFNIFFFLGGAKWMRTSP
jgi:hypothetical protein